MNLSELIEAHKGKRSYPDLQRDCGGQPSAKRLQQLATTGIKNFPDPPTIQQLSKGLRVPQRVVVLAAAKSLGLYIDEPAPRLLQLMPAMASTLSEEQAAAVAHLVDVIVRDPLRVRGSLDAENDEGDQGDDDEPTLDQVKSTGLRAVAAAGNPDDADEIARLAREERKRQGKPK